MFFDDLEQLTEIAARTNCSIFAIDPETQPVKIPKSTWIQPLDGKTTIAIKQIRDLIAVTQKKRRTDHFFIIAPAEAMTEAAANALLKTIEQPPAHCHFIFLTKTPSQLLPTILSRSQLYYLRQPVIFDQPPEVSDEMRDLAKRLMVARPTQLSQLADEITKSRANARQKALQALSTAIEMLYKSFCLTGQPKWLDRIPKFITAYENISQNGHIKLHLVADLC